jgi:uncharacterized protein YhbP (UPF0306 family)
MLVGARPGDKLIGANENVTRLVALATIRARVAQNRERYPQVLRGAHKIYNGRIRAIQRQKDEAAAELFETRYDRDSNCGADDDRAWR